MILTASPIFDGEDSEAFRNAAAKKREWCRRHLGITDEHDFVCTVSWKKHNFVGYRPASVQLLIDDREKNCAEWERAGGVALRYTTWEETRPRVGRGRYMREK